MSRRIFGVEVVEVVLGEWLFGTPPHQAGHPGDEDVADGVGIDGVKPRFVLDFVGLVGDTGLVVYAIEILVGGLELDFGVRRVYGPCGNHGGRRETCWRSNGVT